MQKTPTHEHAGHRQRLMEKVLKDACCEHEFLEMMLCYAIPRRNTNDLAHRLLAEFGSVPQILQATPEELQSVKGIGKNTIVFLKCMHKFFHEYVCSQGGENEFTFPETYEHDDFLRFVSEYYRRVHYEVLDVYFMDDFGRIFRRKRFSGEKHDSVYADVEELSALLASLRPSGIVMVHNHPIGSFEPSAADDQATKNCQSICSMHNVLLCNHVIYSSQGVYDYYGSGRLQEFLKEVQEKLQPKKEKGGIGDET